MGCIHDEQSWKTGSKFRKKVTQRVSSMANVKIKTRLTLTETIRGWNGEIPWERRVHGLVISSGKKSVCGCTAIEIRLRCQRVHQQTKPQELRAVGSPRLTIVQSTQ